MFALDPTRFKPAAVSDETRVFLDRFLAATKGAPSAVNTPVQALRAARAAGNAVFPIVHSERAEPGEIAGPAGPIVTRTFRPANPRGAMLHFHGGGFVMGGPDQQDMMLERLSTATGLTVVSTSYRFAPEHPFPAAPDDCEAAAKWFVEQAQAGAFGGGPLAIGGESAGAYLAVTTLLRLRDQHAQSPFAAALLNYGAFDLSLTPSARNWGDEYMILSTPILRKYLDMFVGGHADRTAPEVSPLHARLNDLPPAFFMVGTLDPLLDDSLFMAQRWMAAGNHAQLEVFAGGLHAFNAFPIDIAREAASCQSGFLNKVLFAGETCP